MESSSLSTTFFFIFILFFGVQQTVCNWKRKSTILIWSQQKDSGDQALDFEYWSFTRKLTGTQYCWMWVMGARSRSQPYGDRKRKAKSWCHRHWTLMFGALNVLTMDADYEEFCFNWVNQDIIPLWRSDICI